MLGVDKMKEYAEEVIWEAHARDGVITKDVLDTVAARRGLDTGEEQAVKDDLVK